MPNMDRIAQTGVVGLTNNVPASADAGQRRGDASACSATTRWWSTPAGSPLETAAMGIPLGPHDWAIRCNLVTVENEEMRDFTAGHIASREGRALIDSRRRGPAGLDA